MEKSDAMFWTIVKREILDSMTSVRFALAMLLCLGMTILSFYVSLRDYERRLEEYQFCVRKQDGHAVSMNAIYRKPEILSIFSQGLDRKLGTMIETRGYGGTYVTFVGATGSWSGRQSHYLKSLAGLDFAFVIRVVFALLAIFLSYHLISGERESGTLKLNLSNPVPRSVIMFGKFCGGVFLLLISLTVSFLIGLLILLFSPIVQLGSEEWIRIGVIYLASVLYLICFFGIGILASSLTRASAISLLVGIVAWICLIFVIPNLTATLAAEIQPVPTKDEMEENVNRLNKSSADHIAELIEAGHDFWDPTIQKEEVRFSREIDNFHNDYTNRLHNQAALAQRLSRISPASALNYAAVQLARTDAGTYRNMLKRVGDYTLAFDDFVLLGRDATHEDYARIMGKAEASLDMRQYLDDSLSLATPNVLILFLFSVLLFLTAYLVFMKREVR